MKKLRLPTNRSWRVFGQIILALLPGVLLYTYWNCENAQTRIVPVRDGILGQLNQAEKTSYSQANLTTLNAATDAVRKNEYTNPDFAALTKDYTAFLQQWEKSTKLTKDAIKLYRERINSAFALEIEGYKNRATNQFWSMVWIFLIIAAFFFLAINSNILRDPVSNSARLDAETAMREVTREAGDVRPPFSLSRTQLAAWIAIIASMYIYAVLWEGIGLMKINNTALLLMGISAGTFAVGAVLDTTEIEGGIARNQNWPSSGNFLTDILSDENGISIHRFQNVVWTFVAIIVYIYRFCNTAGDAGLPDLDQTLIALTGISSATYLTLKTRENVQPTGDLLKVSVTLGPDPGLTDAAKLAAIKKEGGFSKAVVTLSAGKGGVNPLTVPRDPTSDHDFVVSGVPTGVYDKVDVSWQDAANTVTMTGGWANGIITKDTPLPISISMK